MKSDFEKWHLDLGARVLNDRGVRFLVWAPYLSSLELVLLTDGGKIQQLKMEQDEDGYHSLTVANVGNGAKYYYSFTRDNKIVRRADPVSRYQPEGIYGPSEVVNDLSFNWTDQKWKGVSMKEIIIYELHVGTFTSKGTFDSILPHIEYLKDELGVTAIELMPIAQFPGERNWGYDGVFLFAPQNSYGGPNQLKKLVNACHSRGLAVILDVVYNHVGPEGNYLSGFAPYFSNKYHTPWGQAINYDDRGSDGVRRFIVSNALYWVTEYHFDGLRLDAIHGIFDNSTKNILQDIKDSIALESGALNKKVNVIAESDLNDPKIVLPKKKCGYGLDSQWSDDFHHSIHAFLTGERFSYYLDYGRIEDIAKSLAGGFVYDGVYSKFRGKRYGGLSRFIPGEKFVVCLQNHDQVGNRPDGARLSVLLNNETNLLKVSAALLIFSPYVPLLFMGEEYGERAPFHYFINHTDPGLVEAVREGRKKEFESHNWGKLYLDPQDEATFSKSKISLESKEKSPSCFNQELFNYYRELIRLRKRNNVLRSLDKKKMHVRCDANVIIVDRFEGEEQLILAYNLGLLKAEVSLDSINKRGKWKKIHNSIIDSSQCFINSNETFVLPPYSVKIYSQKIGS